MSEETQILENSEVNVQPQEKYLPQSEVNKIISAVKRDTANKTRAQVETELRNSFSQALQEQEGKVVPSGTPVSSASDLESLIDRGVESRFNSFMGELNKQQAERDATAELNTFWSHLGDKPFSEEVQKILNDTDYDSTQLMRVVPLLNELKNTREVFDHLILYPAKLSLIESTSRQSANAARLELKRISNALQQNIEKNKVSEVKEPLSKINNFNVGNSGGKAVSAEHTSMSVSDFQKYLSSRRR